MSDQKKERSEAELKKALQVLAEDRAQRMEECMKEIQAILDKYGFDLVVSNPVISLASRTTAI